jgi:DNA polymerase-3 subunit alpha
MRRSCALSPPEGEVAWLCERIGCGSDKRGKDFQMFPDRYYIELQENTLPEQAKANRGLLEVASELKLPLVATNDCHYLKREDARAHEILLCIQTGKTMGDPTHMCFSAEEFYLKSPDEMAKAFHYAPEALSNTIQIADRCNLSFDFKTYHFPKYTLLTADPLKTN